MKSLLLSTCVVILLSASTVAFFSCEELNLSVEENHGAKYDHPNVAISEETINNSEN